MENAQKTHAGTAAALNAARRAVRLLVLDVDGTLTDGKIYMGPAGEAMKAFDIKDGYAIANMLPKAGILPAVITGRESAIVANRCAELGIRHLYQGRQDKPAAFRELLGQVSAELGAEITGQQAAYMGDDLIDLECMRLCAVRGCPADAAEEVKAVCQFVSRKSGGNGAAREFIEWLVGAP